MLDSVSTVVVTVAAVVVGIVVVDGGDVVVVGFVAKSVVTESFDGGFALLTIY